jgi:hypothetical protein
MAQAVIHGLSPLKPGFAPGSIYVGLPVDKVAMGHDFLEFFGFPYQCHSTVFLHNHRSSGR